jgi:hypothetical protein
LGAQGGEIDRSIHQRAAEMKEKHREEAAGRRKSSSCLGDGLVHSLAAMVGPTVTSLMFILLMTSPNFSNQD